MAGKGDEIIAKPIIHVGDLAAAPREEVVSAAEGPAGQGRDLVFCVDGTWNHQGQIPGGNGRLAAPADDDADGGRQRQITNVWRLACLLRKMPDKQVVHYFEGVGSDRWVRYRGGVTGKGAPGLRNEVYAALAKEYRPGDRIHIFGFSRGAAVARMLACLISDKGICEKTVVRHSDELGLWNTRLDFEGRRVHAPAIEMLGVWDTVASFGLPINTINLFADLHVAGNIRHAFHLCSLDENRIEYSLSPMNHRRGVTEEIWFPGVHSDIGGGGSEKPDFARLTLLTMAARARQMGLALEPQFESLIPAELEQYRTRPLDPAPNRLGPSRPPWRIVWSEWRKVRVEGDHAQAPKVHVSARLLMEQARGAYRPAGVKDASGWTWV